MAFLPVGFVAWRDFASERVIAYREQAWSGDITKRVIA